jgi:hypothetical protein
VGGLLFGLPFTFLKKKTNKVDIIWSWNPNVVWGKKLCESKNEKLWVHELFDELTTRDESFSEEAGFALKLFCH